MGGKPKGLRTHHVKLMEREREQEREWKHKNNTKLLSKGVEGRKLPNL